MAKKKKSLLVSLTPSILAIAIGGYTIYSFGGDVIKSTIETEVLNCGYATVKEYDDSENVESEVISNSPRSEGLTFLAIADTPGG